MTLKIKSKTIFTVVGDGRFFKW